MAETQSAIDPGESGKDQAPDHPDMGVSVKPAKPVRANSASAHVLAAAAQQALGTRPRRASESKTLPPNATIDENPADVSTTGFLASLEQQWTRRKSQWFDNDQASPNGTSTSNGVTTNGANPVDGDANIKCHICNLPLRMLRRRHQCRNCGLAVCAAHSQNQMPLPHLGIMREARVCDICVHELVARRAGVRQPAKRRTRSTSSQSDTPILDTPPASPTPTMLTAELPPLPGVSETSSATSGVLFSCLLEEQANIMDEILYVSTFRMGGRALASRHMNANVAIWKDRWCMLTSAELLTFKATTPNTNTNTDDDASSLPVIALGELRSSVHLTDILHIEVHEEYPRILSIMKSDGRMFRVRTKTPEQCQDLAATLNKAQQEFQHVMDRLNRGGTIDDFAISCVTIQHESSLPEWVIASAPSLQDPIQVDMYPSSLLRFYVSGPEGSGVAQYSSQMIQSCDPTVAAKDNLIVTDAEAPNASYDTKVLRVSLSRESAVNHTRKDLIVWTILVALGATSVALQRRHELTYAAGIALLMMVIFTVTFHDPILLLASTKRVHFSKRFCVKCVNIAYSEPADESDEEGMVAAIPDDELDIRFVEGCKGDLREARERLVDTLRWRKRERMDEALVRPQPNFAVMKAAYTLCVHKRDRQGHIITIGHVGYMKKMREDFLSKGVSEEDAIRYHMFLQEYMWDVIDPREYPDGTLLAIVDMKGISMGDIAGDVFNFMRPLGEAMGDRYPERLFHTFVINPPAWFSLLWKLVLPSINPKTRERVHVVRGQKEIAKELLEYVDEENLPAEYGGKCECPGGCFTHSPEECDLREYVETYLNGMEEGDPRIAPALEGLKEKYRKQNESFEKTHLSI